ncbi:MAG: putative Sulfite:cytochrome c oxidoreductase, subunit [Thermomicrobiales bacterium]|nr:putative Sulfite:cytochrome c oxidoreductase, subunit [Thermomicrobiales bacterium]
MAVAHRPVMSSDHALSRRRLVGRLALAGFSAPVIASILRDSAFAQDATPEARPTAEELLTSLGKSPEMIQRGSTTFETPMALVADDFLTPNDLFFIRSNGPVSIDIPVEEWRLAVTGLVDEELDLTFDDLQGMSARTITAFLECSGNSRSRFDDDPAQVEGTQWENGAIGNAEWTGVSLVEVLNMAGIQEGAVDVVSQGGDFPEMQRGLPLNVATHPDVMLVWEMNGEPLPAPNGGPVRLLVPTWSGIASTKWVVAIDVIDHPFAGPFNSESYVFIDEDERVIAPVREVAPKSIIASPASESSLNAGPQQLSGFAWSGYAAIDRVEVSTDDGATWNEAEIVEEAGPTSWVRFTYEWDAAPGETTLASRATDQRGLTQPITDDWNAKGYLMNAIHEVSVIVAE